MERQEAQGDILELSACIPIVEAYDDCEGLGLEQLEQLLAEAERAEQATAFCDDIYSRSQINSADGSGTFYATTCGYASSYGSSASTGTVSAPTSPMYSASDSYSPAGQAPVPVSSLHDTYNKSPVGIAVTSLSKLSPGLPSISVTRDSSRGGKRQNENSCQTKKRKVATVSTSSSAPSQNEKDAGNDDPLDGCDAGAEDSSSDCVSYGGSRSLKWHPSNAAMWHQLFDKSMAPACLVACQLDADKGINFSSLDSAFISQKKNHFQVTCTLAFSSVPHFVVGSDQVSHPIDGIYVHMYGVKKESPSQIVKVEQSQADRTKKLFEPMLMPLDACGSTKVTIARLHFMETTNNNMRKKGKPNPDQRYFQLVVGLYAHCQGAQLPLAEYLSDKIIVRASNPGQFESEPEVLWQKGNNCDAIYHYGQVGINCDRPDEALVVNGNVKVMGRVLQPSDERVKNNIKEVDSREQLLRLAQLRMYRFKFREEFGDVAGLSGDGLDDTGVLAQQLYDVLPDAVHDAGDVILSNGELVQNLLVVNKDRLFMESVGAVKELCKVTETLESRVVEIEKINSRLSRFKRPLSLRSTVSSTSTSSATKKTKDCSTEKELDNEKGCMASQDHNKGISSSPPSIVSKRMLQNIVISLVVIMCLCLAAIVALYLLEKQGLLSTDSSQGINSSVTTTPGEETSTALSDYLPGAAGCTSWSLVTTLCASTPQSCVHVCGAYGPSLVAANTTAIPLLTTGVDSSSKFTTAMLLGSTSNNETLRVKRRVQSKRQAESTWPDLFNMVSLSIMDLKSKNIYNLTQEECLSCDIYCSDNCNNYTLILFVHTSYPVNEIVTLRFIAGWAYSGNHGLSIASCGLSWDSTDANNSCDEMRPDPLSLTNVLSPSYVQADAANSSYELPKSYAMPVGLFKKSKYKFRIGYTAMVKGRNLCSLSNNSPDFVEININVVRTRNRCIDSILSQIQADLAVLQYLSIPPDTIDV